MRKSSWPVVMCDHTKKAAHMEASDPVKNICRKHLQAGAVHIWAYIFGAICPKKGKGAGLVLPYCDTEAMQEYLVKISNAVDPGAHAVLILDQAGWHVTPKLKVPDNITLMFLPPRSPELNPVENLWQFMRDNWLSNRVFKDYDDIVDHCCRAWNKLIDQPWKIMSIGMREWAHRS